MRSPVRFSRPVGNGEQFWCSSKGKILNVYAPYGYVQSTCIDSILPTIFLCFHLLLVKSDSSTSWVPPGVDPAGHLMQGLARALESLNVLIPVLGAVGRATGERIRSPATQDGASLPDWQFGTPICGPSLTLSLLCGPLPSLLRLGTCPAPCASRQGITHLSSVRQLCGGRPTPAYPASPAAPALTRETDKALPQCGEVSQSLFRFCARGRGDGGEIPSPSPPARGVPDPGEDLWRGRLGWR